MTNHPRKTNQKKGGMIKVVLIFIGTAIGLELLIQIVWPSTILTPNTIIDGTNFGLWDKNKAASMLDITYNNTVVEIYFGDNTEAYVDSTMDEVGISASNARRVSQINYPPQWRLIPTSLLWYGLLTQTGLPQTTMDEVTVNDFIRQNFGDTNHIEPVNAELTITEESIDLKKSQTGGTFSFGELKSVLRNPDYTNQKAVVRVDIVAEYPQVNSEQALSIATTVSGQLINDIMLTLDDYDEEVKLPVSILRSWITFEIVNGELMPVVSQKKLDNFLEDEVASLIEKSAGVTTITTNDLASIERSEGDEGKVINTVETGWRLTEYLLGKRQTVVVAVESIDPTVEYVYERVESEQQSVVDEETDDLLETEGLV